MSWSIIQDDVLHALERFDRDGEKFDAVVMDPPYCSGGLLPAQVARSGIQKYCDNANLGDFEDGMSALTFWRFMIEVFTRSRRVMKKPGYLFTFIDWRMYSVLFEALERSGLTIRGTLVWFKLNSRPNRGHFLQDSEFIIYATNGATKSNVFGGHSVITCPAPLVCNRIHPTQKPEKVYAHLYRILNPGARILELFSGSASGGVAAIANGFDYIGVESSPLFVAASRKRLREEADRVRFLTPSKVDEDEEPKSEPLTLF